LTTPARIKFRRHGFKPLRMLVDVPPPAGVESRFPNRLALIAARTSSRAREDDDTR